MKVVILGCGRVGAMLAAYLDAGGHEVTIIDKKPEAFRRLDPAFKGTALTGTGIDEDVLTRAGLGQADAFASLTESDNTNITASQIAKLVFRVKRVVTRIYDSSREDIYRGHLGLETVCPTTMGATRIKELLRK